MPTLNDVLTFSFFLLLSCYCHLLNGQEDSSFGHAIDRKLLGLKRKEKLSHFKFYWHDIVSGRNPPSEIGLLMAMNFAFIEGKYNGSTITILGRNCVFHKVREMPVIGGSGLFRFARGYAEARTHWFDLKAGDAIVEYNVYVMHY
ncbi:hypothetical protein glysoja_043655 [Glycine soja]|uniref:Dirigent protein n=1 Tax=Glycine soja TaxID=3848 RepID=A0A0B2R381_GLYSO|nr:hypothetical protein glysoja_043655 [Glycine soja]